MNSVELILKLEEIAKINSQNQKAILLEPIIDDPFVLRVLKAALDPFITYGIVPSPTVPAAARPAMGTAIFDVATEYPVWKALDGLASRSITGNDAKAIVLQLFLDLDAPSYELVRRILIKDLRCAVTATIINKLRPGTIAIFSVMLAHKYEEKRIKHFPVAVEPKLDGVRTPAIVKDGKAKFFSRSGKPFNSVDHLSVPIAEMIKAAKDFAKRDQLPEFWSYLGGAESPLGEVVLEGEIVSGNFNKTVGDIRRKDEAALDAQFHIFDFVPFAKFEKDEKWNLSYSTRREFLEYLLKFTDDERLKLVESKLASSHDEIQEFYAGYRAAGLEGAMVKPLHGVYVKSRSHDWLKVKNEDTEDLRIVGAFEGEGKYVGKLGGLIVDRAGVQVKVGGGFSDIQRDDFWLWYQTGDVPGAMPELIGQLIEVEYHEVTPDGSLRHPRFIRFRNDKDEALAAA